MFFHKLFMLIKLEHYVTFQLLHFTIAELKNKNLLCVGSNRLTYANS